MDRVDALRELLANVEAGSIERHQSGAFKAIGFSQMNRALKAYNGSLDAAKALHDAVLGYKWSFEAFRLAGEVGLRRYRPTDRHYGYSDGDPARAWLIAILRALIAQEEASE